MGKVEDMGHLIKLPVENGHSSRLVTLPKFKKRKVSAVRDFPPRCGQNVQTVISRVVEAVVPFVVPSKNNERMDDICDVLKADASKIFRHEVESQSKEKIGDVSGTDAAKTLGNEVDSQYEEKIYYASEVATSKRLETEVGIQSKEKSCDALRIDAAKKLGNEVHSQSKDKICYASDFDVANTLGDVVDSQSRERLCDASEMDAAKTLGDEVDSETTEALKNLIPMDIPGLSKRLESEKGKAVVLYDMSKGEEFVNVEPLGIEVPLALDNEGLVETLKYLEYNTPKLLKDSQHAEFLDSARTVDGLELKDVLEGEAPPEDISPGILKSWSPSKRPTVFPSVDKKKYPPRRSISAVRDFPLLCGTNAPHLGNELCQKAISSSKKENLCVEKCGVGQNLLAGRANVKRSGSSVDYGDAIRSKLGVTISQEKDDRVPSEPGRDATLQAQRGTSSDIRVDQEDSIEKAFKPPLAGNLHQQDQKSRTVIKRGITGVGTFEEKEGRQVAIHAKEKSLKRKLSSALGGQNQLQLEDPTTLECALDKVIVQGLMAAPVCPWRQGKGAVRPNLSGGVSGSKVKKVYSTLEEKCKFISKMKEMPRVKSTIKKPPPVVKDDHQPAHQIVVDDVEGSSDDGEGLEKYRIVQRSRNSSVSLPPLGVLSSGDGGQHDATVTRNKVRETLRLFQAICRKLLHENEAKSKGEKTSKRIDLLAAGILKDKGKYVNKGKQIMGLVPGVEVGDEFHYRVELNIVGLHRQIQGGIDYLKQGREIFATSIVASGGYADDLENSDTLIYSGSGGNVMQGDKEPEDQKLERGNLALKNSISQKSPVRVIRGFKELKAADSSDARAKVVMTYIYDGLYMVQKYWQEMGQHGKLVFKFQLNRIQGQPELAWKEVKKANKFKVREGICLDDVSQGKELMPICAVNVLDDNKPPLFEYITSMIYPDWYHPTPPVGCDCVHGCSDSDRCSCASKNGGEIPYNLNGDIVEAKPLVYECGPACKCPPSCHNRVSQQGIKFQLEIFKTASRGWGVRSLNSIASGSFICEYIGELLEDKEADQRAGNDEYLFDIGHNYNDRTLWDGLSSLRTEARVNSSKGMEDAGFTIDAAQFGNVGRFINHSCSPNLYAQNVLYDHEDKQMPHIMFFAAENIPPLQELTYHYNYTIDQVRDSNGNIKKKYCYCGSPECTGRMY